MKFVKVNFDDSVRDAKGGIGYVIWDPDSRLLAATGSHLFEPSIHRVELCDAWASIIYTRQVLRAKSIFVEDNSVIIID